MKSNVLAALMALMILSFGINAFSAVSEATRAQVNNWLGELMTPGETYENMGGSCETVFEKHNGNVIVSSSVHTWMGTAHYRVGFGNQVYHVEKVNFAGDRLEIISKHNELDVRDAAIITRTTLSDGRKVFVSVEYLEEKNGIIMGRRFKSVRKC